MNIYEKNYKLFLIVPAILFLVFLVSAFVFPGLKMGRDLAGGTSISIRGVDPNIDVSELKGALESEFQLKDVKITRTGGGVIIEYEKNPVFTSAQQSLEEAYNSSKTDSAKTTTLVNKTMATVKRYISATIPQELSSEEKVTFAREKVADAKKNFEKKLRAKIVTTLNLSEGYAYTKQEVVPTLGEIFWSSALKVALIGMFLVILVIFIFFREVIPSIAVIGAAIFDIAGALGLMALIGIPLNLSSITALLMLIGYSVDTDIMLTTRLLKRKEGSAKDRAHDSMKTGLTMTGTTLVAITVMLVISYLYQLTFIFEIAIVILFGLLVDILSTWLMNAPILLWYVEKKKVSK